MIDYRRLYTDFHEANPKLLAGYSTLPYAMHIETLVATTGAQRLLDYGSGKGYQYLVHRIHEQWGGILPYCYDPGVRQLASRPTGLFDGVICCDVLEHIAEEDLPHVLGDIFSFLLSPTASMLRRETRFAFFVIGTGPAKKCFPDGQNLHLTIRPKAWWLERVMGFSRKGLRIEVEFE